MNALRATITACCLLVSVLPCLAAQKTLTEALTDNADAIVVASVRHASQSGKMVTFTLTVNRSLKGDLAEGAEASGTWESTFVPLYGRVCDDCYGLWFLKKTPDGQWTVSPAKQGPAAFQWAYFPLSKSISNGLASFTAKPTGLTDRVVAELTSAIEDTQDAWQRQDLAHALMDIPATPVAKEAYQRLSRSSNAEMHAVGLAGLVRMNEFPALAQVADEIESLSKPGSAQTFVLPALWSVFDTSPKVVALLGRIAASPNPMVQKYAAEALANIHTLDTLPFLGALLDSPDPEARLFAMGGFCMFVDNAPLATPDNVRLGRVNKRQGPTPYRTSDTDRYSVRYRVLTPPIADASEVLPYLEFWRRWWSTHKDELIRKGN